MIFDQLEILKLDFWRRAQTWDERWKNVRMWTVTDARDSLINTVIIFFQFVFLSKTFFLLYLLFCITSFLFLIVIVCSVDSAISWCSVYHSTLFVYVKKCILSVIQANTITRLVSKIWHDWATFSEDVDSLNIYHLSRSI